MSTSEQRTLSTASKANAGFLILAGIGIFIQKFSGVDEFPTVPPGAIILLVSGLLVALLGARWAWTAFIGLLAPLYLGVASVLVESGVWDRLADPASFGPFIGSAVQMGSMAIALVAGAGALYDRFAGRKAAVRSHQAA
ncbi:hypothetical protein [Streptomyces sp. NPDC002851]